MKILLIGFGFVGKATYLLNNKDIEIFIYDCNADVCLPKDIVLEDIVKIVDIIFISLPTPTYMDGSCYTKLIDDYITKLNHNYIIIRSTVPIGYCDSKNVFFMPEFLTEKDWKNDFINNKYWMFGIYEGCPLNIEEIFKEKINYLINSAYNNNSIKHNNIRFGKNKEMELNKLIRNTFLATKVSYFNEIYDLTQKIGINYNNVIDYVKLDDRIGNSHMSCPGTDNMRGYGGTCFPKDINSLYYQLNNNDINSYIIQSTIDRNENNDRLNRDWLKDLNRTNVKESEFKIILVTGGSSIIGSNLCKKLLENKFNKVICLDNLITGDFKNIKELLNNDNFKFKKFDIKNKLFLPHIDEIYNLSCIINPKKYNEYSIELLSTCFEGTKNILDLVKKNNSKLLFVSTEYKNNYDNAIKIAETLLCEYKIRFNIDIKNMNIIDESYNTIDKLIYIMNN